MTKARDIADGTRYVDVTGDTMTGKLQVSGAVGDTNDTSVDIYGPGIYDAVVRVRNTQTTTGGAGFLVASRTDWSIGTNKFLIGYGEPSSANVNIALDASGRVFLPRQPAFLVTGVTAGLNPSTNASAPAIVDFVNTRLNTGNHYNNTTNTFTAPVAGSYFLTATVTVRSANDRWYTVVPVVNGTPRYMNYWNMQPVTDVVGTTQYMSGTFAAVFPLAANDTVKVGITSNAGLPNTWDEASYFSGYLIG